MFQIELTLRQIHLLRSAITTITDNNQLFLDKIPAITEEEIRRNEFSATLQVSRREIIDILTNAKPL